MGVSEKKKKNETGNPMYTTMSDEIKHDSYSLIPAGLGLAGVWDVALSSDTYSASIPPKVPLEEIATQRFLSPFSRVTSVLKCRMKWTITLPGLKAKQVNATIYK